MRADGSSADVRGTEEGDAGRYQRLSGSTSPEVDTKSGAQEDGRRSPLAQRLDKFFSVSARGSSLATEVRAGCISWMTMSYIMVVNPVILGGAQSANNPYNTEAIMMATALSAAVGSFAVGVCSDAPLGLMPGMGLNAYFTWGICHTFDVTWQEALSCVFVSGVLLMLLAATGINDWLVSKLLSDHLKKAITVAIGLFQALIGFQVMGLVVHSDATLVTIGDLQWSNHKLYLAAAGFCLISAMLVKGGIHGALLIGIWAMAALAWLSGIAEPPHAVVSAPRFDTAFAVDFAGWLPGSGKLRSMLIGSVVLLFVSLFDLAGVQYGLLGMAGLLRDGKVPRSTSIYCSSAIGTMAGALLGTSPVIIANECSAGIMEGARTGLSAVVVAALFLLSAFISPLLGAVPKVATAVPLVLIGAFMMSPVRSIDWDSLRVAIPSFLTVSVVPFTYSIHSGIMAGILMDLFLDLTIRSPGELQGVPSPGSLRSSGRDRRLSSPKRLESRIMTPHGNMAGAKPSASERADGARRLRADLALSGGAGGAGDGEQEAAREEALARALDAYLEGFQ